MFGRIFVTRGFWTASKSKVPGSNQSRGRYCFGVVRRLMYVRPSFFSTCPLLGCVVKAKRPTGLPHVNLHAMWTTGCVGRRVDDKLACLAQVKESVIEETSRIVPRMKVCCAPNKCRVRTRLHIVSCPPPPRAPPRQLPPKLMLQA